MTEEQERAIMRQVHQLMGLSEAIGERRAAAGGHIDLKTYRALSDLRAARWGLLERIRQALSPSVAPPASATDELQGASDC
jgi:DnaJ-domain-containing protein 1